MGIKSILSKILKNKQTTKNDVFTEIYQKNSWKGVESFSGRGSDSDQTRKLREELPRVFTQLSIKSIVDVPCGDFNWMRSVITSSAGIDYIGGDIVTELVQLNTKLHSKDFIKFNKINLLIDQIPNADLLFCRDCLVHLSFQDISLALRNIRRSTFKYVAFTNFPDTSTNKDIKTGNWRTLNLNLAPFDLPPPIISINEECSEGRGKFSDKSLNIYKFEDIFQ